MGPERTIDGVDYLTFSGWIDRPTDVAPSLTGDVTCDVAVLGGGYAGMATALRLAERGVDVVLLESGFCGWGASSRNAGHLTPKIGIDPQLLTTVYRRRAANLVRMADHAVHFTEDLIERRGVDCDYEPTGNVLAATSTGQMRRSERTARILRDLGADADVVEGPAAGLPEAFPGGVLERPGGLLNPGAFARGLRRAVLESRTRVFEHTSVQAIEPGSTTVALRVPGGRVHAERVVLATNAYTHDLPFAPKRIVVPTWSTLGETERIDPARVEATGWTSRSGIYTQHLILENYRPTARGTIVFGTRQVQRSRGPLGARTADRTVVADLLRGFHERFPSLRDVAPRRTWGGWIAMTPSWVPVVGEAAPNIHYAVGYNGHGLAQAPYLGTLLADHLVGDKLHDDLRAVWRARPRFAPAPHFTGPALRLGWAADRIADRFTAGRAA